MKNWRASLWISWKLWWTKQTLFGGTALLSLLGLVLGVASLVVSMAVMSGFETTLKSTMADVSGHVTLVKRSRDLDDWQELSKKIKSIEPSLQASTRFTFLEAIAAKKGAVQGVLIQGLDPREWQKVLNVSGRIIVGTPDIDPKSGPRALIGQGLAQRLGLNVGDKFRVVVPVTEELDPTQFSRQTGEFMVSAVLDLGKYEWNQRFLLTDIGTSQKLARVGEDKYTGLILRFEDIDHSRVASFNLSRELGLSYHFRDWRDVNENLFEAVNFERVVIFFVVFVIVIVSAFNISSTLFVNVVRRYHDIALLKTLGLTKKSILRIYALQGLFIGGLGLGLGIGLGFILCLLFSYYQSRLGLISGAVYKLEYIQIELRLVDVSAVVVSTLAICLLATWGPAKRGAKLSVVEGLRYG